MAPLIYLMPPQTGCTIIDTLPNNPYTVRIAVPLILAIMTPNHSPGTRRTGPPPAAPQRILVTILHVLANLPMMPSSRNAYGSSLNATPILLLISSSAWNDGRLSDSATSISRVPASSTTAAGTLGSQSRT